MIKFHESLSVLLIKYLKNKFKQKQNAIKLSLQRTNHLQIQHPSRRHLQQTRQILPSKPSIQLLNIIPLRTTSKGPKHCRLTLGLMQDIDIRGQPERIPYVLVTNVHGLDAFLEINPEKTCARGAVHVEQNLLLYHLELRQGSPFVEEGDGHRVDLWRHLVFQQILYHVDNLLRLTQLNNQLNLVPSLVQKRKPFPMTLFCKSIVDEFSFSQKPFIYLTRSIAFLAQANLSTSILSFYYDLIWNFLWTYMYFLSPIKSIQFGLSQKTAIQANVCPLLA